MPSSLLANVDRGIDFSSKSVDITGQLKVLPELTRETSNPGGTHSIILQHLLPTTVEFIEQANSVYPVDLVISITYSTDARTVEVRRDKGYNVSVPPDLDYLINEL